MTPTNFYNIILHKKTTTKNNISIVVANFIKLFYCKVVYQSNAKRLISIVTFTC